MKNFLVDNNKTILNIAAGKIVPIGFADSLYNPYFMKHFIVQLDPMYYSDCTPTFIEESHTRWLKDNTKIAFLCPVDAYEFMERIFINFNHVSIYRFLEHVSFTKVPYFIYLVSTVIKKGGIVDVIVPNYETLAKMIIQDDFPGDKDFEGHNILLTTELLNQPPDPHASVWTPDRMKYFWELEDRFKLIEINNNYEFDGRDIYIRAIMERI
jgi:predicted SAM-dependent methyltransferase